MPGSRFGRLWLSPVLTELWLVRWTGVGGEPMTTAFLDRAGVDAFVAHKGSRGHRARVYRIVVGDVAEERVPPLCALDDPCDNENDAHEASGPLEVRDGSPADSLPTS